MKKQRFNNILQRALSGGLTLVKLMAASLKQQKLGAMLGIRRTGATSLYSVTALPTSISSTPPSPVSERNRSFPFLLSGLVLVILLAITYGLWHGAQEEAALKLKRDFDSHVFDAYSRVRHRMLAYEQVLRGTQGLFSASKSVERDEFRAYYDKLHLDQNYPGIQGIGFAQVVSPAEKDQLISSIRKQGFPKFTLWPEGKRDFYTAIIYVEPFTGLNLQPFGYDMYTEPARRAAMEQARDTDKAALSSHLKLLADSKEHRQAGFKMYLPVYKNNLPHNTLAERRDNLVGWVYGLFRMDNLMRGILGEHFADINVEIFDGKELSDNTKIYNAGHIDQVTQKTNSRFKTIKKLEIAGHTWMMAIASRPDFEAQLDKEKSQLILVFGVGMSILLTLLTWLLATGRERALTIANKMTAELKLTEVALRSSEERLKIAADSGQVGIWDYNVQTNELIWDDNMFALYGARREDFSGAYDAWATRLHPEDRAATEKALQDAIAGIKEYEPEFRVVWADGEVHYIKAHGRLIKDQAGNPVRMIGTNWDNRAYAQAQQQLELAYTAFNKSKTAYFWLNLEGRVTDANDYACLSLGLNRKELVGLHIWDFDPDFTSGDLAHMKDMIKQYGVRIIESRHQRKDGTTFPVEVTINYIDFKDEICIFCSVQDITERKYAEQELRIAATAFESREGLIITDAKGVILRINRAFSEMTGYTSEEAIGNTPAILNSGQQDVEFYQTIWKTIGEGGHWKGEIWNRRKNGETFPVWLSISVVKDNEGQVTHYIGNFSDISDHKAAEEKIRDLAFFDPLTRLPNRRLLTDRLQHAFTTSARNKFFGAVLFIDLDNFKAINDTKGHAAGDLLLIEVANRLQSSVREGDTIARLGGDEFVVVLEDLDSDMESAAAKAKTAGEKILAMLCKPYLLHRQEHPCSASIGISLFGDGESDLEDLLRRSDTAMYEAKKAGRNTLRFFDPAMQHALEERAKLELWMRQGMCHQFSLHYQQQVDIHGHPTGAEALLRWKHPERGMIAPAQFIPLAEETGLILPIGQWVLETACAQLKAWEHQPHTQTLSLAVNVSAYQFRQPNFVELVQAAITRSGIDPAKLKLELTESLVLDSVDDVIEKMQQLKLVGVSFAMDDFGTGHSSLSYLKRLPLDQLKIDQSFVCDIATDSSAAIIVRTIINMGQTLGMSVIAEGVETEEQLKLLRQYGCQLFQGNLFGRPLTSVKLERSLAEFNEAKVM